MTWSRRSSGRPRRCCKCRTCSERLRGFAYEPVGSTPEEFGRYFQAEIDKFAKVVKDAHIPMQD